MGWDSTRDVPWQRLIREWLIYVAIMAAILAVFFRDSGFVGAIAGLLVSGPLYVLAGFVLAKLGYRRQTLSEMRTPRAAGRAKRAEEPSDDSDTRARPAPTKRTSGGGNRPKSKPRRR